MVNRNDDTVTAVFVGGRAVFLDGEATDWSARSRTGRFLRAAHQAPAVPAQEGRVDTVSVEDTVSRACGRRCRRGTGRR